MHTQTREITVHVQAEENQPTCKDEETSQPSLCTMTGTSTSTAQVNPNSTFTPKCPCQRFSCEHPHDGRQIIAEIEPVFKTQTGHPKLSRCAKTRMERIFQI